MKELLSITCCLLLLIACNKEQAVETVATTEKSNQADVIYYYKEQAYPLYLEEGSTADFVQDENFVALQQATAQSPIVTFHYSDQPLNHVYLFDSEFEGYDYMEKHHANPLLGRKFKISLRIDELRERLIAQYGEILDFKDGAVAQAAQQGVAAIYEELHINLPLPNDLEAFIGISNDNFVRPKTGSAISSNPVLTVWEHDNLGGAEMYVDQAPNTVIWNYGDWNCFTMAANPDLTLEFKPDGTNWNDCISSKCLSYIQGADAMSEGYYKDSHFGVYACGFVVQLTKKTNLNAYPGACFNMRSQQWVRGHFCGHINDQISSIRIKAIWEGCYEDDTVFNDLYNL
ncbi:MAG: hypothetical protein AB8E82_11680 [Aureispira sp.]